MSRIVTILAILALLSQCTSQIYAQTEHPNIIVILTDDQGWNGTSVKMDGVNDYSKSDFYLTPNLEQLAEQGMVFSQARAASPMCSPSRYSILTGQNPSRLQMTDIIKRHPDPMASLLCPNPVDEIDQNLLTLPQALKSIPGANYNCASFGKWHMGDLDPEDFGFDFSDGPLGNGPGNEGETLNEDPKKIFSITQSGIEYIEDRVENDQAFFLQLNHFAVHLWPQSLEDTFEEFDSYEPGQHFYSIYGAMTADLDTSLGQLFSKLEELEIVDNTYIFFTTDNGSVEYQGDTLISPSYPLQNGKTFVWEGGLRVPFIVKGPNVLPGSVSHSAIVCTDLFPTIIELAGGAVQEQADSKSFTPLLSNPDQDISVGRSFVFNFPHFAVEKGGIPQVSMVKDQMKFLLDYESGTSYLFDLANDVGEENDLSLLNEEVKEEMALELRNYLIEVEAQMPVLNSNLVDCDTEGDCDGDGLPDQWEFRYLLSAVHSASDDPDGDGYTNLEEFFGGGDPMVFNQFPLNVQLIDRSNDCEIYKNASGVRINFTTTPFKLILVDLAGRTIFNAKDLESKMVEIALPKSNQSYILSGTNAKGAFQHHFFY